MITGTNYNKKGSAIITAVGMGTVLLIIIVAVFSFSKYRTQTVVQESKRVKALAFAEAGLDVAIAELTANSSFVTHKVTLNPSEKSIEWTDEELPWENKLEENTNNKYHKSNHSFAIDSDSDKGTLSGHLGDGLFKVRVGNIPYEDNENTPAVDESKAYVIIESMGFYDKTVRRIVAIVNKRYPTREFLMYDGGVLSLIYGQTGNKDPDGVNVFSTGHLYGHRGIEISRIKMDKHTLAPEGTTQKLNNINAILSGDGGIFFYSPIKANFKSKTGVVQDLIIQPNSVFPSGSNEYDNATAEEFGQRPESLRNLIPPIPDNLKPWIKDRNDGNKITPETMAKDFKYYKEKAQEGGLNNENFAEKYRVHKGWNDGASGAGNASIDVVYLDFGNNIHKGNITKDNFPSNGYIYSDKDIVIKGNPPKDCHIISEKNIFIAGDFNQAGNEDIPEEKYGFPQIYEPNENALNCNDYSKDTLQLFKDDINAAEGKKHHVAATIVAKERIVYDHRSPVDCFENELYPYLKYELAKAISETENETEAKKVFEPSDYRNIRITASSSVEGFKASMTKFTENFKIANPEEFVNSVESVYTNSGSEEFDFNKLDDLAKITWEAYVKDFEDNSEGIKGQPSASAMEHVNEKPTQGIYTLLFNLRKKMCGDEYGDKNITEQGGYLCYPEMTTNGMFVSYGALANTSYAGPSVTKYYDEIGFSSMTSSYIANWYHSTAGFVHRTYGSETYLRLNDNVVKHTKDNGNNYYPPTRRKIYDDTLPFLDDYGNDPLELTAYIIMSWEDFGATEDEFYGF